LRDAARVVVLGGGIIGWSIARDLARRNRPVLLLDDAGRAGSASRAAAGMLSPLAETGDAGALHDLAAASLDRFPAFVAGIEQDSGVDVEYVQAGKVHAALGDDDAAELARLADSPGAARFGVELIDGRRARALEPQLTESVHTALHVRRDHRVDNRMLHAALRRAALAAGVQERVVRVVACETSRGTITGVRLADGRRERCGALVLAAGAWSGELAGIDAPPVHPVRGQMLAVLAAAALLERVVASRRCYVIPRRDGRLLIGATVEEVGFDEGVTADGIDALRAAAVELVPAVAHLPVTERWFGFRPATPDGLPILGRDVSVDGVFHATGHYRNGILLAPITGAAITALVLQQPPPVPLDAFTVARFR
jgi:glycine oxidase